MPKLLDRRDAFEGVIDFFGISTMVAGGCFELFETITDFAQFRAHIAQVVTHIDDVLFARSFLANDLAYLFGHESRARRLS